MNELYPGFTTDGFVELADVLTQEYPLAELDALFCKSRSDRIENNHKLLTITAVHEVFPIEIIRPEAYSVYRVKEGGYYYVFWTMPYADDIDTNKGEPTVYCTAYCSSPICSKDFDSVIKGKSTAFDVLGIDPYAELSFLQSNAIYSYSLLDSKTIVEIKYTHRGEVTSYADLLVQDIMIISRELAPSSFKLILPKDFPK